MGSSPTPPDLAELAITGLTLADICGVDGGDETGPAPDCDACRLASTFADLQGPCVLRPLNLRETTVLRVMAQRLIDTHGLDPVRLVRAPPQA